jgi:rubrerythrin
MTKIYFLPEELLPYLDFKHPNLAMYIRNESIKIDKDKFDKFLKSLSKFEDEEELKEQSRIINKEVRYNVLKRQQWKCNQCGEKLKYSKESNFGNEVGHIDHIHPYSKRESYKNGSKNINETSNLQALCPSCNKSKFDKLIQ